MPTYARLVTTHWLPLSSFLPPTYGEVVSHCGLTLKISQTRSHVFVSGIFSTAMIENTSTTWSLSGGVVCGLFARRCGLRMLAKATGFARRGFKPVASSVLTQAKRTIISEGHYIYRPTDGEEIPVRVLIRAQSAERTPCTRVPTPN